MIQLDEDPGFRQLSAIALQEPYVNPLFGPPQSYNMTHFDSNLAQADNDLVSPRMMTVVNKWLKPKSVSSVHHSVNIESMNLHYRVRKTDNEMCFHNVYASPGTRATVVSPKFTLLDQRRVAHNTRLGSVEKAMDMGYEGVRTRSRRWKSNKGGN